MPRRTGRLRAGILCSIGHVFEPARKHSWTSFVARYFQTIYQPSRLSVFEAERRLRPRSAEPAAFAAISDCGDAFRQQTDLGVKVLLAYPPWQVGDSLIRANRLSHTESPPLPLQDNRCHGNTR